jgi:hypothetical protein
MARNHDKHAVRFGKQGVLERMGSHPSFVLCKIVVRQIVIKDAAELPCRLYSRMKLICPHLK